MRPTFIGIENVLDTPSVLTFDGQHTEFGPKEVRIVESLTGNHALSRMVVRHAEKDGKPTKTILGIRPFRLLPLSEALKRARPEEDPDIVEARKKIEDEVRGREKLVAEVREQLKKEGWQGPSRIGKHAGVALEAELGGRS